MQIKISNVDVGEHSVRDDMDEEHIAEIADSFEQDDQWNPIIVRPGRNGNYNLIAGHYRLEAAKRLGWDEIEASARDVSDVEADMLSLKTNLMRQSMSQVEEGKVLQQMIEEYDLTQKELAERVGKSPTWVNQRLKIAFDLHEDVTQAVDDGDISFDVATVIGRLEKNQQPELLESIVERGLTDSTEASRFKRRFDNDTIYTIGYSGRGWNEFVTTLENNNIDILVDTRKSAESQRKPEFNGEVIAERLEDVGIEYTHRPELGVDYLLQEPYKNGWIGDDCFEDWYQWWLREKSDVDIAEFAFKLEGVGKSAMMCVERYAKPIRDQDIYCHRHFLASALQTVTETEPRQYTLPERGSTMKGRRLFSERIDL